jgi:hypothetical protein
MAVGLDGFGGRGGGSLVGSFGGVGFCKGIVSKLLGLGLVGREGGSGLNKLIPLRSCFRIFSNALSPPVKITRFLVFILHGFALIL